MDVIKKTALENIAECIQENKNFVLQGGAGSGKTETLKKVLEHTSNTYPDKKVVCITHTNLAVDEIISRVGGDYTISTIHSFLNTFIKDYKKNIHQVIFEIFRLKKVERKDISEYENEREQNTEEHKRFKKLHKEYAKKLYTVKKEFPEKVTGKRDYDKDPVSYNLDLNTKINDLNDQMKTIIDSSDYNKVGYNETRFDSFKDLTFSHDNLLKIATLLFRKYPLLSRIIQDKFDFIFIDEYQDSHKDIIDVLLNIIPQESKTVIGLFGDSMQGIYEDGIGDVEEFISSGKLCKIEKEDNFRCSQQVVDFINLHRNDGLNQEVAFKIKDDGKFETIANRQGIVKLYYSVYPSVKPHVRSSFEDKEKYLNTLKSLISIVEEKHTGFKKLMLTNKSISSEVGFKNLYDVFNDRYYDVKDEIEKCLTRVQLIDLIELCSAYENKDYNFILTKIKKAGFQLKTNLDKKKVSEILGNVTTSSKSIFETLELAFEYKLLKKSESYLGFIKNKESFIEEANKDDFYAVFKKEYKEGSNTFSRMSSAITGLKEEKFNDYEKIFKKERFYLELFSDKIKFDEILKYFGYLNEETDYITMHKTKGSGIKNVLIVLDEYFWIKYNFKTIFDMSESDLEKKLYNQKLFYVACSRAIENLVCVKLITEDEKDSIIANFPLQEEIFIK